MTIDTVLRKDKSNNHIYYGKNKLNDYLEVEFYDQYNSCIR